MISGPDARDLYGQMLGELGEVGTVSQLRADEERLTRSTFEETFGAMFDPATFRKAGARAEHLYSTQRPDALLVLGTASGSSAGKASGTSAGMASGSSPGMPSGRRSNGAPHRRNARPPSNARPPQTT